MTTSTSGEPRTIDYATPAPPESPTRVRYGVLFFLCTMALLLYADRVCIGQAAPSIQAELGLSKTQMAWVFNAFTLAYCLFEVPTGHWGDRYGSRGVIARIVFWWSLFTALTGAAFGFWSLVLVRFLFGAGEAGAFPNAARVVTRWFPPHSRGLARGSITTVSLLGGVVSGVVAGPLIATVGWRWTFVIFGAVGVAWAFAFYVWFRDDPAEHPGTNAAERELIGTDPDEPAPSDHPAPHGAKAPQPDAEPVAAVAAAAPPPLDYQSTADQKDEAHPPAHIPIPWARVLTSPNVWLLGALMTVSAMLFYMQFQWYPTYLKEARGQGAVSSGWMTSIIYVGGAAGCIAGGLLADVVMRRTRERKWSRRLCGGGALLLAAVSVLGVRLTDSALAATLCNAAALFFVQMAIPTWWAVVAEISGRHGAAMWGLMNSMAGLGVMGINVFIARLVELRQARGLTSLDAWGPVFNSVAGALAVGVVCWMFVDATRSAVEARGEGVKG